MSWMNGTNNWVIDERKGLIQLNQNTKKLLKNHIGLILFNSAALFYNVWNCIHNQSLMGAISIGAIFVTLLWVLVFLALDYGDYKEEKRRISFYTKMMDESEFEARMESLKNIIDENERLNAELKDKERFLWEKFKEKEIVVDCFDGKSHLRDLKRDT